VKLFTREVLAHLAANGKATRLAQQAGQAEPDHKPVVKIFDPCGAGTWLITESNPDEPDLLFGLADLGMQCPELGYISKSELEMIKGRFGIGLVRDRWFSTDKPLSAFVDEALNEGRIEALNRGGWSASNPREDLE
jgi:hypothetical protein